MALNSFFFFYPSDSTLLSQSVPSIQAHVALFSADLLYTMLFFEYPGGFMGSLLMVVVCPLQVAWTSKSLSLHVLIEREA